MSACGIAIRRAWKSQNIRVHRVKVDRSRRQAVADDDGKLATIVAPVGQQTPRSGVEHAAKVGTAQIVAPVGRLGIHQKLGARLTSQRNATRPSPGR